MTQLSGQHDALYTGRYREPRLDGLYRGVFTTPAVAAYVTRDDKARAADHQNNRGWFAGCPVRLTRVGEPAGAYGDADVERLLATVPTAVHA